VGITTGFNREAVQRPQRQLQPEQPLVRPIKPRSRSVSFHCQLAHGSQTGVISGVTNVRDIYRKIADCYDIQPSEVRIR
jgi:hypothetical protein